MASDELETLYREHYDEVWRYVCRRVPNRHACEDIVQDVFVRAAVRLELWEERGRPKLAWLYTIAGNLIIDRSKSGPGRFEVATGEMRDGHLVADPIEQWHSEEGPRALLSAIGKLKTDEQKRVMLLRHVVGLSVEDTAAVVGVSEAAVKAAAYRATKALGGMLTTGLRAAA